MIFIKYIVSLSENIIHVETAKYIYQSTDEVNRLGKNLTWNRVQSYYSLFSLQFLQMFYWWNESISIDGTILIPITLH